MCLKDGKKPETMKSYKANKKKARCRRKKKAPPKKYKNQKNVTSKIKQKQKQRASERRMITIEKEWL